MVFDLYRNQPYHGETVSKTDRVFKINPVSWLLEADHVLFDDLGNSDTSVIMCKWEAQESMYPKVEDWERSKNVDPAQRVQSSANAARRVLHVLMVISTTCGGVPTMMGA